MSRLILKELFLAAMVGCFVAPEAWAMLRITEICPRPDALDPNGKEAGWIELQNTGEEAISLSNYGLIRFNRGKAEKTDDDLKVFPSELGDLGAGERIVIYTSEEYPNVEEETFEVYPTEDPNEPQIAVFPFKVNPKKFPTVRLYRMQDKTLLQTFMVPVDLADDKSFGPGESSTVGLPFVDAESAYDYTVMAGDEVLAMGQGQGSFAVAEKIPTSYVSGNAISTLEAKNAPNSTETAVTETDGVYDFRLVSSCRDGLRVTLAENTTLTDGFAASFWFKTAQSPEENNNDEGKGMVLFECRPSPGPNGNNAGINLFVDGEKKLRVQPRSANKATQNIPTSSENVTDEAWHHVVLTGGQKEGETITVYYDGEEVLSSKLEKNIDLQLDYVCFGCAYNSSSWLPYIGQLKEMAFFPRVLTQKEAKNLMASTLALEAETTSLSLTGVTEVDGVVTFAEGKASNVAYVADATTDFPEGETVDFWVKPTTFEGSGTEATVLVDCRPGGGQTTGYLLLRNDDGMLYVQRATGTNRVENIAYAGTLTLNQWNHVTFTLDPETDIGTLYINGVMMQAQEIAGYEPSSLGRRFGGTYDAKGWWHGLIGKMADVRVFNQVLDATEIAKLHNAKAEARGCDFVKSETLASNAETVVNVESVTDATFVATLNGTLEQAISVVLSVSPTTAEVDCFWNGAAVTVGEVFEAPAGDYTLSWQTKASNESILVTAMKRVEAGVTRVIMPSLTKGQANDYTGAIAVGPQVGPQVGKKASGDAFTLGMTFSSNPAKTTEDLEVTYTVYPFSDNGSVDEANAITGVGLRYQIGFGEEVVVPMASEDGITWKATIPTAGLQPGQLIRCAAEITDVIGATWRSPSLNNLDDCPAWYGTIVEPDPNQLSATLQTFHLFADAAALRDMDTQYDAVSGRNPLGARVGIYDWNSKTYYDNVRIDLRGNTSASFSKKSHGLRFNKCQPLIFEHPFDGEEIEVRKTSFTAEWPDPSYLRQSLSFHIWRNAGALVPFHYPVRLQLNGAFYQMAFHTNRFTDELIEDYYGLDPMGYAYKNVGTFNAGLQTSAGGIEKKTPDDGDETSDAAMAPLRAFVNRFKGVTAITENAYTELPAVTKVVVQHFDLPAWINYLSIARITQETDDSWANISAYYDINGTNTWMPLAYDHNLSFGAWYVGDEGRPVTDSMRIGTRAKDDNFKSHPFYGGTRVRAHRLDKTTVVGLANNAIEAVWQSAKFRRLYLRRLRTLMDEVLMKPDTKQENTPFWTYVTTLQTAMQADAALDRETNGYGDNTVIYAWKETMSPDEGIADIWNNYVVPRREHLFYNHVAELEEGQTRDEVYQTREVGYGKEMIAGIPAKQSPIADLAAKITVKEGFDAASGVLVLQNANEETIDMSGWKLSGAVSWTIPTGTVIDAQINGVPGEVYIVADRNDYVTENESDLTDQVIIGNADFTNAETLSLVTDDEITVISVEPSALQNYLRVAEVYSSTKGDGDTGEYIVLKNMSDSETLNLKGVKIIACKNGDPWEEAKCNFTIASDLLVTPGETVRLEQATYDWNKLTNGKVDMKVYAPDGAVVQTLYFSAGWWLQTDGWGASLVAIDFSDMVTEKTQWKPSFEVPPMPEDEDAAAVFGDAIAAYQEIATWLNGFSEEAKAELLTFKGTSDDIVACWLVNVPLCAEPEIELTVTTMTFDANGTLNMQTKLVVNGVERDGAVNGMPVLIGYTSLTDEGEEVSTAGKTLPFNLSDANAEKSYRFFRVRIR